MPGYDPNKKIQPRDGERTRRLKMAKERRRKAVPYEDDLEFLNKLTQRKLSKLQSAFKNEGRGLTKKARIHEKSNTPGVG